MSCEIDFDFTEESAWLITTPFTLRLNLRDIELSSDKRYHNAHINVITSD